MNFKFSSLVAAAVFLGVSSAHATSVPVTNNGASVTPGVTTVMSLGTVAMTSGTITGTPPPFPGAVSTFSATYTETVIKDALNPFGSGDLTFEMTFTNSMGSSDALEEATNGYLAGFSNFSTDVGYLVGTGVVPSSSNESNGTINFAFLTTHVAAGASSDTLIIETNATNYTSGTFSLIDSETGTNLGYIPAAPISATPEPSSLVLLGTGILGLAGAARRKLKK